MPPSKEKSEKKRKKSKKRDPVFTKESRKRSQSFSGNPALIRLSHQAHVKTSDGEEKIFKSSFLINKLQAPHVEMNEAVFATPSFTPIEGVLIYNEKNSPIKVFTPKNKTVLSRVKKYDGLSIYCNEELAPPELITKKKIDKEFLNSDTYQAIKEIKEKIKIQEVTVTPAHLKETKQHLQKNLGKRSRSQSQVIAKEEKDAYLASANKYVQATQLFSNDNIKWEWLHLVAHLILGKEAQKPDNLVAGTQAANNDMLVLESLLPSLAKKYPEGFKLTVEADMFYEELLVTQIAKEIRYHITTNDFNLVVTIDPHTTYSPHVDFQKYFHHFVEGLQQAKANTSSTPNPRSHLMFYHPKEKQDENKLPANTKKSDKKI